METLSPLKQMMLWGVIVNSPNITPSKRAFAIKGIKRAFEQYERELKKKGQSMDDVTLAVIVIMFILACYEDQANLN